jgi:hypothetical protein
MIAAFIFYLIYLFTLLLLAIYAVSVYKKVPRTFHPMLIFLVATFVMETFAFMYANSDMEHRGLISMQYLGDSFLICWQARRWGVFDRKPGLYYMVLGVLLIAWLTDVFLVGDSETNISWFRVIYSFAITLIGLELLSKRVMVDRIPILKSPIALFSIALIFFFGLAGLAEIFMIIGQLYDQYFLRTIFIFYIALGVVTNFVYLRAILCISKQSN